MASICQWILAAGVLAAGGSKIAQWIKRSPENSMHDKDQILMLRADILPFSNSIDPAAIRSAGDYIVLSQISRMLVTRKSDTQIVGDLAQNWEISPDFRTFIFHLDPSAKFSDGSPVHAEDMRKTLLRTKKLESAIHYDFKQIADVKAEGLKLILRFHRPQPDFLTHAVHPEFSPLHRSDYNKDTAPTLAVTAGAYFVRVKGHDQIELEINPHFKNENMSPPGVVHLRSAANNLNIQQEKGSDFIMPLSEVRPDQARELEESGYAPFKPHIGFSYWISINPLRIPDRITRNRIQTVFSKLNLKGNLQWQRAEQLFLPEGPSRLSSSEVGLLWREVQNVSADTPMPVHLKVLMARSFPFKTEIKSGLESSGVKLEVVEYADQAEYAKLISANIHSFDLIQSNNDFSSADVIENLTVALNPTRPLIHLGHDADSRRIFELFQKAQHQSGEDKQTTLGLLGAEVLRFGFVAPLVYFNMVFYTSSRIDVGSWSTLYPEVAFWKVKGRSQRK